MSETVSMTVVMGYLCIYFQRTYITQIPAVLINLIALYYYVDTNTNDKIDSIDHKHLALWSDILCPSIMYECTHHKHKDITVKFKNKISVFMNNDVIENYAFQISHLHSRLVLGLTYAHRLFQQDEYLWFEDKGNCICFANVTHNIIEHNGLFIIYRQWLWFRFPYWIF